VFQKIYLLGVGYYLGTVGIGASSSGYPSSNVTVIVTNSNTPTITDTATGQ
jgi:hypothetical protein